MLTLLIFAGLMALMLGGVLAFKKRRLQWFLVALPFLLAPLALYAMIAFACYFGSDCL
jgi:hypothetical protein